MRLVPFLRQELRDAGAAPIALGVVDGHATARRTLAFFGDLLGGEHVGEALVRAFDRLVRASLDPGTGPPRARRHDHDPCAVVAD